MHLIWALILSFAVLLFPIGWAPSSDSFVQSGIHLQAPADGDYWHCHKCDKDSRSGSTHHHFHHAAHSHLTMAGTTTSELVFEANKTPRLPRIPPEAIPARLADINRPPPTAFPA